MVGYAARAWPPPAPVVLGFLILLRRCHLPASTLLASLVLAGPSWAQAEAARPDGAGGVLQGVAGWLERNPRRLQQAFAGAGIYPSLGSFAQGTGPAPGLTFFQPRVAGGPFDLMVSTAASFRGDSFEEVRIGRLPHAPGRAPSRQHSLEALTPAFAAGAADRVFVYAELRRRDLESGELYDELGAATPYRLNEESLEVVGGYRLGQRWVAAVRAGTLASLARVEADSGSPLAALREAGPNERERFLRTAVSLAFDDRDDPRHATRGSFFELTLARFAAERSGFGRLALDARHFVALGSERNVLAFRACATLDSAASAPFYLLDTLGGGERLRGYQAFRFRGPKLVALSAEYRRELARPLEGVAFYDAGRVWGGNGAMGTEGLLGSYGLGLRLKSSHGVLLRLEAARGAYGTRGIFKLGYAF